MINVKFLILNVLVLGVTLSFVFGAEYKALSVTSSDKEALKKLDDKLYKLVNNEEQKKEVRGISEFIFQNLRYDLDYSRLTVTATSSATALNSSTYEGDGNRNKLQVGVSLSYPLFDPKEINERKKTIITVKQKISSDVKSYLLQEAKIHDLQIALLIQQQLEIRAKARKLEGVGGFDDWLKIINEIKKIKEDLTKSKIEKQEAKEVLFSYLEEQNHNRLEELLK